jgi:hypothetical protein
MNMPKRASLHHSSLPSCDSGLAAEAAQAASAQNKTTEQRFSVSLRDTRAMQGKPFGFIG